MNEARRLKIQELLTERLHPTQLDITDDSHAHIGHEGAKSGAGHFTVRIASHAFDDQSQVAAHRMVYQALGSMMESDIHALRIEIIR